MALSEFTRRPVEKKMGWFCREKVPEIHRFKERLDFRIEGDIVTLFEERAFYCDSRWGEYYLQPKRDFEILLREVDEDPLRLFWE